MSETPEPAGQPYPALAAPGFGRVLVGDDEWTRDFFVRADGAVKRRKKKPIKALYGSGHVVGPNELERVCKRHPHTLIIATGYAGVMRLAPEGEELLRARGITVRALPTPEAVEAYAATGGPKAIIVHVTC